MTTGALIFAFNNEKTDYIKLAAWSAKRIKKFLNIPTAVITDSDDLDQLASFDKVIKTSCETGGTRFFQDYNASVSWHNASRVDAYSLTPWEQTLVLDADYVVNTSNLSVVLDMHKDFLCFKNAKDITGKNDFIGMNTFGKHRYPMHWATVMMFRKSPAVQYIFDCMHMVKNNYAHYRHIYGFPDVNYRNDFALTIALSILSGHTQKIDTIPWPMFTVLPEDSIRFDNDEYVVEYSHDNKTKKINFRNIDVHVMGKSYLEKIIENTS